MYLELDNLDFQNSTIIKTITFALLWIKLEVSMIFKFKIFKIYFLRPNFFHSLKHSP